MRCAIKSVLGVPLRSGQRLCLICTDSCIFRPHCSARYTHELMRGQEIYFFSVFINLLSVHLDQDSVFLMPFGHGRSFLYFWPHSVVLSCLYFCGVYAPQYESTQGLGCCPWHEPSVLVTGWWDQPRPAWGPSDCRPALHAEAWLSV